ncbi:hypothetical protein DYB38_013806 [Aphanomyces astaci]|uniref:Uncharacterized protein n=1 Tax=Aphanomyces astaci TaxID=112090 RepID=A0A397EYF8_APHAT|nr:hypothetical protein DYB38_013806 [Aphanomyces astaci]RHZ04273.1 hypothetical protein DYB31_013072 [Aphanomyces astaci]
MGESPIVTVVGLIDSLDEAEAFLLKVPQPTLAVLRGRIVFTERRVSGSSVLTVYFVAADDDAPIDDLQLRTCKASGDTKRHNMLYLYGAVVFDVPSDNHEFAAGRIATSTRTTKHKRENGTGPFTCNSNFKSWSFDSED